MKKAVLLKILTVLTAIIMFAVFMFSVTQIFRLMNIGTDAEADIWRIVYFLLRMCISAIMSVVTIFAITQIRTKKSKKSGKFGSSCEY